MSELEDKINSILSDSAQMEKITNLAKSLMGGELPESRSESGGSTDQNDMLSKLMGSLGGGSGDSLGGIDPAMLARIGSLMQSGSAVKREEQALLEAMRPYLSEKRRKKMDRAMNIARLARIARLAAGEMGEKGND